MSLIKDHLISRSNDAEEIRELHEQTENDMKQCLTWCNHTCFRFGTVSGVGIFVLTGQEAYEYAGPVSDSSYVGSGVSAMLCLLLRRICSRNPSSRRVICLLKDSFSFHNTGKHLESNVETAAAARAWVSYFMTLPNHHTDSLSIHKDHCNGFNLLDLIAIAVLAISSTIAMISTRKLHTSIG
ncbi:cationic amino acid transporter 5 [Quercus suber]|uniref:Cationic amino acid transporter 5 n=1 Tax=Quercus suber TaxID=58331 RepID=A0AAW0K546_QUESU